MFGLGVHRPRLFESNAPAPRRPSYRRPSSPSASTANPTDATTYRYRNNGNYKGKSLIRAAEGRSRKAATAMGIDWMTWDEIRKSIPPAYTR